MSRYWNGHQWKDLSPEESPPVVEIAKVTVTEPVVEIAKVTVTEPVVEIAKVTITEPAVQLAPQTPPSSVLLRSGAVPTHAEYGDVFVAAAAEVK